MALTSLRPSGPTTISTTINASDARVTGGNALQFQGGAFAPVGASALSLTNAITVLASSTGTLDATSQDITSTGAVTINGTSLTLTGSTTSVISLSGDISGAGILINASGNNVISGTNTCAGISVTGGSLRVDTLASMAASNNTVSSGGTMILRDDGNYSAGTLTIAGTGCASQLGALVFDGTGTSGYAPTLTLSADATIAFLGNHDYGFNAPIDATTAGTTLTIDTGNARMLPDGGIGANIAHVIKEGSGMLYLRSSIVGDVTVNAGFFTRVMLAR